MAYKINITLQDKTNVLTKLTYYNSEDRGRVTGVEHHEESIGNERKIVKIYGADALDPKIKLQGSLW